MKKALIYFTMIVGIIAFIGACKSDDSSSSATTTSTVTSCSDTASGSITGIDNQSVSGTYSLMSKYTGTPGVDNSTGCTDNASLLAVYLHGECMHQYSLLVGSNGLIASDLPVMLPHALDEMNHVH